MKLNRQDIEIAIDLTRLAMIEPCLTECEYVVDAAEDLMTRHYVLLMALENSDDILKHTFSSKPLRIAKHTGE